jgi:hypothetical protein
LLHIALLLLQGLLLQGLCEQSSQDLNGCVWLARRVNTFRLSATSHVYCRCPIEDVCVAATAAVATSVSKVVRAGGADDNGVRAKHRMKSTVSKFNILVRLLTTECRAAYPANRFPDATPRTVKLTR